MLPEADARPECAGTGSVPYNPNVAAPWAYGATIKFDNATLEHYFYGIVVEWFDRNQSLSTAITLPAMGNDTSTFGSWPIKYRPVPCPIPAGYFITFQFLDVRTNVPLGLTGETGWLESAAAERAGTSVGADGKVLKASDDLCDNQPGRPCGKFAVPSTERRPLESIKMIVASFFSPTHTTPSLCCHRRRHHHSTTTIITHAQAT
ncbi:hypothetical protein FOA52_003817 [Chlamydomonas sp. UWO 241]|nr:hypothetical protein FOA52_003817 [Chlamydomonas sp. UWO 241]